RGPDQPKPASPLDGILLRQAPRGTLASPAGRRRPSPVHTPPAGLASSTSRHRQPWRRGRRARFSGGPSG
uniref:Uncharacterized protein n=1 Tax=Aegilops tauschii subsp. strangulata TaxID=200361 RepID=A0A453MRI6_AEGTS